MSLRSRVLRLERSVPNSKPEPVPDSRQLLEWLELFNAFALDCGIEQLRELVRASIEPLQTYINEGRVDAYVEYECRGRLVVMHGRMAEQAATHDKLQAAFAALDGLAESLRLCLQIDRWRTDAA